MFSVVLTEISTSSSITRWAPSPSCVICCKQLPLGTLLKARIHWATHYTVYTRLSVTCAFIPSNDCSYPACHYEHICYRRAHNPSITNRRHKAIFCPHREKQATPPTPPFSPQQWARTRLRQATTRLGDHVFDYNKKRQWYHVHVFCLEYQ